MRDQKRELPQPRRRVDRSSSVIRVESSRGAQRRRIVLFGQFGTNNLGNEATLEVMLHHLRKRLPNAEVVCICSNPAEVERKYGVASFALDPMPPWSFWRIASLRVKHACVGIAVFLTEPFRMKRVLRGLGNADQLLIAGTGVLDDYGQLPYELPLYLFRWCHGAKKAGAAIRFVSIGAGPIRKRLSRFLMKGAVRLSESRYFRDTVSKEYLGKLGINTENDEVVPDLVFSTPPEKLPLNRRPDLPAKTIGVGVMAYFGWSNDKVRGRAIYESYIAKLGSFVAWLLRVGYKVRLITGQVGTDDRAVRDLLQRVAGEANTSLRRDLSSEDIDSFDDMLREIALVDIMVATRFHNLICSLMLGRPALSIGYSGKHDALMAQMGLLSYCQNIEALDVEKLILQFCELVKNYEPATEYIRTVGTRYRMELDHLYDSLFGRNVSCDEKPHIERGSDHNKL
jgi:polysaccharide pyruvyl transferase WcaK-like protein